MEHAAQQSLGWFSNDGFLPHGHCYLWEPGLLWTFVISDSIIALAYFSIPFGLMYFVSKRVDFKFNWIFKLFSIFILSCGITHLLGVWTIWHPDYWLDAFAKVITAATSLISAILLWPLIPRALKIPSTYQLELVNAQLLTEIEMRKLNEAELLRLRQNSDEKYRILFESSRDALMISSVEGEFLSGNPSAIALYGCHDEHELTSLTPTLVSPELQPDGRRSDEKAQEMMHLALENGSNIFEWMHRRADGKQFPAEVMLTRFEFNNKVLLQASVRDITQRKNSEDKIQRLTQLYAALSQCNQAIVRSTSAKELFQQICCDVVKYGGMKMAWIGLVDERTKQLKVVASFGDDKNYLEGIQVSLDENDASGCGPCSIAIRENRPYWCQDFQHGLKTASWCERGARFGFGASASLPISKEATVIGSLTIYAEKPDAFDKEVRELLEEMAADISFALDNFANQARRRHAEKSAIDSAERFQLLFDSMIDAVFIYNMENHFLQVNKSACTRLGYSQNELLQMGIADIDTPEYTHKIPERIKTIQERGESIFETAHVSKDGKVIPTELSVRVIEYDRKPALLAVAHDITERKQAELILKQHKVALETTHDGFWIVDMQGVLQDANQAYADVSGYSVEELRGMHISQLEVNEKSLEEIKAHIAKVVAQGYDLFETRHHHKDGHAIDIEVSSTFIPETQQLISFCRDISERKSAEENLQITASVFDISQEAIMITDADNIILEVNSAFSRITGYNREEVIGKNPNLLSSGRQNKAFYAAMWQFLNEKKAWRGEIWNRRKSGEIYPEMLSISVLCDSEGKVLRHVAVFSDISHIKEHEAELNRIAHFDALTNIPNRLLLADRMRQAIAQTSRDQNMMAICYLDLDGFKPINDSLGHEAGDQMLIEVAKRIGNTIRGGDTVARLGGDEFVVLLIGLEKGEECVATLERLLAAIAQPITVKNRSKTISASIGVSIYPLDDEDPDTLLRHADQSMYVAKQSGKNRFHIYDPALDRRARDQHEILKSIRHGLEQDQFELYYQPKVNLRTKEMVGAEALIRWRHPERGLLTPAEFLPHIENTDLDIGIGEWVTTTALAQMNHWRSSGLDIEVSINISGYHLESSGFVENLRKQLASYPDMMPGKLQIEVLETVALKDIAIVRDIIESCRKLGVGFALDDFGTGYSSLSYLSGLPVDTLKIDQSFVRDMLEDKGDLAIVQGIIALAQAFDRKTVAEGIETEHHFQVLNDMGCESGQGYGIARPMPADKLANWHANFRLHG